MLSGTDFGQIANSLNTQLNGVQTQLNTVLDALKTGTTSTIPFLGKKLGDAAQIINKFETNLHTAIASLGTVTTTFDTQLQTAIINALGPSGLNILGDANHDGTVNLTAGSAGCDVIITHPGTLGTTGFEVEMQLVVQQALSSTPINFDVGLPSLPIKVTANGSIQVNAGFDMELAFTYNSNTQGVGIDDTKTLGGKGAPDRRS